MINADLDPAANKLTATAAVTFTALEDLTSVTFELNNGLQLTKLTDAANKPLQSERLTNNSTVHITLATPLPKDTSTTYNFEYSGALVGSDTSPVEGIKLAAVAEPISILLYAGRWFPMTGLFTNRFTAEMHIRVPSDERVVGSGFDRAEEPAGDADGVQLQLEEAGVSGDDCGGQVPGADQRSGDREHQGVCDRAAEAGSGRTLRRRRRKSLSS